ncbi:MAG: class I SAM-dependent DNA methyltransferase [Hyphomicrobiaceae bacterium]
MSDARAFLDTAYDLDSGEKTHAYYSQWAKTYDQELIGNGYASPARTAQAMAGAVEDVGAALLDVGCGTGLSGEALKDVGFTVLDGSDFSPEMLALAATKNVYRDLKQSDLAQPIPAQPGEYANVTAVGVFSPGHAPAATIQHVVSLLPAKGCFGFTLNDHALEDPSYQDVIDALCEASVVETAVRERGPHLPKIGLEAIVYVLRKLS